MQNEFSNLEICYNFSEILSKLSEITSFYNRFFPNSMNSLEYKKSRYLDLSRNPIVLIICYNDEVVALLESWLDNTDFSKRKLVTLLVSPILRNSGLSKRLFSFDDNLARSDKSNFCWVVHFRNNLKQTLEKVYIHLGFSNLVLVGKYSNGEDMWEMTKRIKRV